MKLKDYHRLEVLMADLSTIETKMDDVDKRLGVTLAGHYWDDLAGVARPHLKHHLFKQHAAKLREIRALGVDTGPDA